MARVGSWDVGGYPATWFDGDADVGGWFDRDAIPSSVAPPEPPAPLPFVFQILSGADVASDYFFLFDPLYRTPRVRSDAIEFDLDSGPFDPVERLAPTQPLEAVARIQAIDHVEEVSVQGRKGQILHATVADRAGRVFDVRLVILR